MENQNPRSTKSGKSGLRRLGFVAVGMGLGSVLAYLVSRSLGGRQAKPAQRRVPEHIVDDRGTGQQTAAQILLNLRDRAFDKSDEKLALALGRPTQEVEAWNAGRELIDDDVVMKARGIAIHRGVRVE
ncbi:MAG: hypothetical protein ABI967_16135 [bacterium]